MGRYVIVRTRNNQFTFTLQAANAETILAGELYATKEAAEDGIELVTVNAARDDRYEHRTSAHGEVFFVLKDDNGGVIGRSEMYSSVQAMNAGVESVKVNGPQASVVDRTNPTDAR